MHWCRREGVPFDNILRVARDHFANERVQQADAQHTEQRKTPEEHRGRGKESAMQQTILDEELDQDPEITR
jgi:hypothetical protein